LLAESANACLTSLLHDDRTWLHGSRAARIADRVLLGGIASEDEAKELEALSAWVLAQGFAYGKMGYDFVEPTTGEQRAIFDLVWPNGVQEELT
jgi:hypothetical protein